VSDETISNTNATERSRRLLSDKKADRAASLQLNLGLGNCRRAHFLSRGMHRLLLTSASGVANSFVIWSPRVGSFSATPAATTVIEPQAVTGSCLMNALNRRVDF